MRSLALVLCMVGLLCAPACAQGVFTISVPGAAGSYGSDWSQHFDFDFGQLFTEISMVEIHLVGQLHPGMAQVDMGGGWFYANPLLGHFEALVTDTGGSMAMDRVTGHTPTLYDTYFDDWYMASGVPDALLDGKGALELAFYSDTDYMAFMQSPASSDIYDLEIRVMGTPAANGQDPAVPEPMSIVLGAMGLVSMAGLRKLRAK